jgi:hypothetical protein
MAALARSVREMPASAAAAVAAVTPGTTSKGSPAARTAAISSQSQRLAGQESAERVLWMAGAEPAEALALRALGQVRAQQALDRLGHLGRGDPVADGTGHRLMPAHRAAHAEVVGVHQPAVDLDLLALDPEVGDPVLAAAVGAAGDVELEVLVEPGEPPLQLVHEPAGEALGLGQGELAELGPGARDRAPPERGGVEAKPRGPAVVEEQELEPRLLPVLPEDLAVAEDLEIPRTTGTTWGHRTNASRRPPK